MKLETVWKFLKYKFNYFFERTSKEYILYLKYSIPTIKK